MFDFKSPVLCEIDLESREVQILLSKGIYKTLKRGVLTIDRILTLIAELIVPEPVTHHIQDVLQALPSTVIKMKVEDWGVGISLISGGYLLLRCMISVKGYEFIWENQGYGEGGYGEGKYGMGTEKRRTFDD